MKAIRFWSAIFVLALVSAPAHAEPAGSAAALDRVEVDRAEYERFKAWQAEQATLKKNVSTVKAVLAAEGREDTEAFFAPFSADSTFWMIGSSPSAGTLHGLPAQKAAFNMFMEQLESGISMEVTNSFASGDWVVTEAVGQAQTVEGRPYNGNYCVLVKFKDDEIVEFREYLDTKLMSDTFVFEAAP